VPCPVIFGSVPRKLAGACHRETQISGDLLNRRLVSRPGSGDATTVFYAEPIPAAPTPCARLSTLRAACGTSPPLLASYRPGIGATTWKLIATHCFAIATHLLRALTRRIGASFQQWRSDAVHANARTGANARGVHDCFKAVFFSPEPSSSFSRLLGAPSTGLRAAAFFRPLPGAVFLRRERLLPAPWRRGGNSSSASSRVKASGAQPLEAGVGSFRLVKSARNASSS